MLVAARSKGRIAVRGITINQRHIALAGKILNRIEDEGGIWLIVSGVKVKESRPAGTNSC